MSVADRLVVDTAAVRQCADALDVVTRELSDCPQIAEAVRDVLGDERVADRLHEFATNWKLHREKIVGEIESLAGLCRTLADELDAADKSLATTLGATP